MTLFPKDKTAWFSSSVPESTIKTWVELGGTIESDALQAEFVFSESDKVKDIQSVFQSKEFLEGHLTVFSSTIIHAAMEKKSSHLDAREFIILPHRQFSEMGITVSKFHDHARQVKEKFCDFSEHENIDELPKRKGCSTQSKSSKLGGANATPNVTRGDGCPRRFFNQSFNIGIVHLDNIRVPPITMMDFKPGINGCKVVKRKPRICQKHNS